MRYLSITAAFICCLIYAFTANAGIIDIAKVKTNELFPVEYQLYAEQSTGYVEVKNTSNTAGPELRVEATVEIAEYTAGTIIGSATLKPGESAKVPLLVAFKPEILSLKKPISELSARIKIAVYSGDNEIEPPKTINQTYKVYSLNRMPQEPEKLAMFVNPWDSVLSEYLADKRETLERVGNRTEIAEKLYAMLQASRIQCFPAPVGKDVKHPRELLNLKLGNSYDCSLLYAALLEHYKVPVVLAFIPQKHKLVTFESPDGQVTWENRKWTPVDMRELKKTFSDAQAAGATSYSKWKETGTLKLVDLRKTWQEYQPVQFETMADVMRANKIESGIKLAQQGELDNALMLFKEMLETDKNDPVAINNLGNLYLLKGDLDKAISTYQRAVNNDAKDAAILLNIGMAYYIQGNDKEAVEFFTQAREHFNYTKMRFLLGIEPDNEQHKDLIQRLEKADAIVRKDNEVMSRPLGTRRVIISTIPVYWKQK